MRDFDFCEHPRRLGTVYRFADFCKHPRRLGTVYRLAAPSPSKLPGGLDLFQRSTLLCPTRGRGGRAGRISAVNPKVCSADFNLLICLVIFCWIPVLPFGTAGLGGVGLYVPSQLLTPGDFVGEGTYHFGQ